MRIAVVVGIALVGLLRAGSLSADRLELIDHVDLWNGSPVRSADAAGITYHPDTGRLVIVDSEISEYGEVVDEGGEADLRGE